jgi:hypothetical protein
MPPAVPFSFAKIEELVFAVKMGNHQQLMGRQGLIASFIPVKWC